jgi:lysophospholipase L1-like esterase
MTIPTAAHSVRILVYGDSNTWGFWVPTWPDPPAARIPFAARWTGLAQAILGPGHDIVEDAMPGRLAAGERELGGLAPAAYDGTAELPAAMARNLPLDLVVIALGTNDLLEEPTPSAEEIAARIVGLVRIARRLRFPVPLEGMPRPARALVLAPPGIAPAPDRPTAIAAEATRVALLSLLAARADAEGFHLVDAAAAVPIPHVDGVHLTPEHHAALGPLLAAGVRAALDAETADAPA